MSKFDFSKFDLGEPEAPRIITPPTEIIRPPEGLIVPTPINEVQIEDAPQPQAYKHVVAVTTPLDDFPDRSFSPDPNSPFPFEPAFEEFDNLVDIHYTIYPDFKLYPWQLQELLRMSGYVHGTLSGPRVHYTTHQAFRGAYVTVNGSGKDVILIATAALGLPLLYKHVIVVITTSSYEQLQYQTEPHITNGIKALKARFGFDVYKSVQFYHTCEKRGAEIKLFVTDEKGRAEGWHPKHPKGRLVLILNEAKTLNRDIHASFDRCSGYSHWVEVSSPGVRRGLFYENHLSGVQFPAIPVRGRFFTRKIHQGECPHKSEEERVEMLRKHGEKSYEYQTSILCNFYEQTEEVCVPQIIYDACEDLRFDEDPDDVGIGLDMAAGGDEISLWVRRGPVPVFKKFFRQADTMATADIVDQELRMFGIKPRDSYVFNYDDNGLGKGPGDNLVKKKWRITRRCNQSPAIEKSLYLNLGAEMYFHMRRLYQGKLIQTARDEKTKLQLVTRKYDEMSNQGKKSLEPKKLAKSRGAPSPDRADGFVLCFYSYRPDFYGQATTEVAPKRLMTVNEFVEAANSNPHFLENLVTNKQRPLKAGETYTCQNY